MPKLILFNLQHQLVQCNTVQCQKNKKIVVYQLMIPFTMTRSSSRARQLLSRVNLTGFTVPTSGKIENICLFRKQLENILNNWLCPNFSCCPKILGCPKFFGGGAAAPPTPVPPARTPMADGKKGEKNNKTSDQNSTADTPNDNRCLPMLIEMKLRAVELV